MSETFAGNSHEYWPGYYHCGCYSVLHPSFSF